MLSVYYHALGRKLELRGAPAVMMPADVEPVPLDEALQTLLDDRLRPAQAAFKQALWTVARGLPPQRGERQNALLRYPRELLDVLSSDDRGRLQDFEDKRREYRRAAHAFGEALDFFADEDHRTPAELMNHIRGPLDDSKFSIGVQLVGALGTRHGEKNTVVSYLESLAARRPDDRRRAAGGLRLLADEVGLPLPTFLEEFAHAVAFVEAFPPGPGHRPEMTVLPASSVTVQDARSLTTMITVTALVQTENVSCVSMVLDPQCWMTCSDAFEHSGYIDVDDRVTRRPRFERNIGRSYGVPKQRLMEEKVRIVWGTSAQELGSFHNLLNIRRFKVQDDKFPATVSLDFDLHRCLSSRVLWDARPGGIIVDEGFAKARQVADGLFRVTVRKTLCFSDRTPNRGGAGWNDLGQLLNFLAPAAMAWWLESEMYNGVCPDLLDLALAHPVHAPLADPTQEHRSAASPRS